MLLLPLSGLREGWAAWGLRVRWPVGGGRCAEEPAVGEAVLVFGFLARGAAPCAPPAPLQWQLVRKAQF